MTLDPGQLRRPMTLGEILSGAVALYRSHFRTFLAISLVTLPLSAIAISGVSYSRRNPALFDAIALLSLPLFLLLDIVVYAAVAQAVAAARDGFSPSFGQSYKHVLSRLSGLMLAVARVYGLAFLAFVPVFLVSLFLAFLMFAPSGGERMSSHTTVGVFLGAFGVGVLPVAYLLVRWAFFLQAVVLEDTSSGEALSYSSEIVHGRWWRAFGIFLVVWLLGAVMQSPATAMSWTVSRPMGTSLGTVIGVLVWPFSGIAYTLLFFDLQSRESERFGTV